jgi:hypothetical protein
MKTITASLCFAALCLSTFIAHAEIIAGPITNPANGHDYYLLAPKSWTESEAEAESLGGTLAIIKNVGEQEWVFSTFGAYGGINRNLWIGLHRVGPQRSLEWVMGQKPDYANWGGGQPDDAGGVEGFVFMASADKPWGIPAGAWCDIADRGNGGVQLCGVVEVPGKSNKKSLSREERELIGTWYESGNADRPAWIVGTENQIFLIAYDRHAARLVLTPEGFIFNADRLNGEILKGKILWSNGTWWSRTPSKYSAEQTAANGSIRASKRANRMVER